MRKRLDRIYEADSLAEARSSHENKGVAALYEEYLGRPLGEVSHRLLHRTYTNRSAAALLESGAGTPGAACAPAVH